MASANEIRRQFYLGPKLAQFRRGLGVRTFAFAPPNATSVLTPERSKIRESESSRPILRGCERNAMFAFALRKFSHETENRPAQSDDSEILRNTG